MPPAEKNYYEILGVSEKATLSDIKSAYRKLALKWHPDRQRENREEAESIFKKIVKAYETLTDETKRKDYDYHLKKGTDADYNPYAGTSQNQPHQKGSNNITKFFEDLKKIDLVEMGRKIKRFASGPAGKFEDEELDFYNYIYFLRNGPFGSVSKYTIGLIFQENDVNSWAAATWLIPYMLNFAIPMLEYTINENRTIIRYHATNNPAPLIEFLNSENSNSNKFEILAKILADAWFVEGYKFYWEYFSEPLWNIYKKLTPERSFKFAEIITDQNKPSQQMLVPLITKLVKNRFACTAELAKVQRALEISNLLNEEETDNLINQLKNQISHANEKQFEKLKLSIIAKLELIQSLSELEKVSPPNLAALQPGNQQNLPLLENEALANALYRVNDSIKILATKILFSSQGTAPADITLLANTAKNVANFYKTPNSVVEMNSLIDNAKQINKKIGSYWQKVKSAVLAVVGIACIIVGSLGLLPSLGASAGLIAAGSALCVIAKVPSFVNTSSNRQRKSADEVVHNIDKLLKQAKSLSSSNRGAANSADISYQSQRRPGAS